MPITVTAIKWSPWADNHVLADHDPENVYFLCEPQILPELAGTPRSSSRILLLCRTGKGRAWSCARTLPT